MAITITPTGAFVVLDETDDLQNATASPSPPSPAGDADDNDILASSLPTAFSSRLITTYGLTVDEAALSGYNGANTDSNILTVTGATASSDFALTGAGGAAFTDYEAGATSTFSSGLFAVADDGSITEVFLFADPTNNNIVYGVAGDSGDDPIAFAIYLEEVKSAGVTTGAKMWTVIADGYTLAHNTDGSSVADHDDFLDLSNKLFVAAISDVTVGFAGAPAGNNLFMRFGTVDLSFVVTGRDPANQSAGENISSGDTVNTSGQTATNLGTNGQQVKAGAGMYFTYVSGSGSTPPNNFIVPNLDQNEADVEANITFTSLVDAQGGAFTISQVNPGNPNTTVSVKITAFTTDLETDVNFVDGLGDADDQIVDITAVTINGSAATSFTINPDGSVVVNGVKAGDVVGFTTDGDHQRVLIENAQPTKGSGSNITFDLGGFSIRQVASDVEEIGSKVRFEDDGPTVTVNDSTGTYAAGAQGTWNDNDPGSDGFASLSVNFDGYEIDDNGPVTVDAALSKTGDFTFEGSITDDFNGDGTDETVTFTLTFDPVNDSYDLDVTTPPPTVVLADTTQGALAAGGPDPVQTLLFGGSAAGADDVVFFGAVATAPDSGVSGSTPPNDLLDLIVTGATDLTEAQIEAFLTPTNQIPTLINSSTQMNVSTSGIGINNNNLDGATSGIDAGDESFVFNPEQAVDGVRVFIDNSVGGYDTATEQLYYRVFYTDGTVSAQILVDGTNVLLHDAPKKDPNVPDPAEGGKFFDIDAGNRQIDAVQLTMGVGTVKIPAIQWAIEQVFDPDPLHLDFTATLFDGDGDSSSDPFSIDLDATVV
ncbi:hypothetical protein EHS39_25420 [Ensifer sp. MPMI2T]|nr:hypothetical protein EHS39_25420 [Ensifer sp. MPMI2T]